MGIIEYFKFAFKKSLSVLFLICAFPLFTTGCGATGTKTSSFLVLYIVTAVFSFLLLLGYLLSCKKKISWFLLLYISILVVNIGYLYLALSANVNQALFANRIAYLGSVFLPFSMFMIIVSVSDLKYKKILPCILSFVAIVVFLIAASPGYSDIYYKSVTLVNVNGVSVLDKVYGPLHNVYMIYLITYFVGMISIIVYTVLKKKKSSFVYPVILVFSVFINIGLWLAEQFIKTDFEMLSVSYIISGMFLLGLNLLVNDNENKNDSGNLQDDAEVLSVDASESSKANSTQSFNVSPSDKAMFIKRLSELTKTERIIYDFYIQGKSTKEIMAELNIKENTLKYHNKNIYGKMGVSSRKQLVEISRQCNE